MGYRDGSDGKNSSATYKSEFNPWVRKTPWRRERLPTPVFLTGESHGQRCLVVYNPWGHRELDMTCSSKQSLL